MKTVYFVLPIELHSGMLVEQVWLEKRYVGSRHTSEWFNTAGRNVKTGLIASVIVSQVIDSILVSSYSTLFTNLKLATFSYLFSTLNLCFCSGLGLLQSCKALMLLGSMELVDLSGMLVEPPSKYVKFLITLNFGIYWNLDNGNEIRLILDND